MDLRLQAQAPQELPAVMRGQQRQSVRVSRRAKAPGQGLMRATSAPVMRRSGAGSQQLSPGQDLAQAEGFEFSIDPATNQPLLHGKAMAQRMYIDVPPVESLFRNVGALANELETTQRPAADAVALGPPANTASKAPYPQPMKRTPRRRSRDSNATAIAPRKRRLSASGALQTSEQPSGMQNHSLDPGNERPWSQPPQPPGLHQAPAQHMTSRAHQTSATSARTLPQLDSQQHVQDPFHCQNAGGGLPFSRQASAPQPVGSLASLQMQERIVQQPAHHDQQQLLYRRQQQQQRALNSLRRQERAKGMPSPHADYQLPLQDNHGFPLPIWHHSDDRIQHRPAMLSGRNAKREHHEVQRANSEPYWRDQAELNMSDHQLAQHSAGLYHIQEHEPGPTSTSNSIEMLGHHRLQQHLQQQHSTQSQSLMHERAPVAFRRRPPAARPQGWVAGNQLSGSPQQPGMERQHVRHAHQGAYMAPQEPTYWVKPPYDSNRHMQRMGPSVGSGREGLGGIVGQVVREAQQSSHKPSPVFRAEEFRPTVVQVGAHSRPSSYHGVRRNCWSTFHSAYLPAQPGQAEIPIGDFDEEHVAARAHDVVAVQQHRQAATINYPIENYNIEDLEASNTTLVTTLHNLDQLKSLQARRGSRYQGVYRRGETSWEARLEAERQERAAAEAAPRLEADKGERAGEAQAATPAPDFKGLRGTSPEAPKACLTEQTAAGPRLPGAVAATESSRPHLSSADSGFQATAAVPHLMATDTISPQASVTSLPEAPAHAVVPNDVETAEAVGAKESQVTNAASDVMIVRTSSLVDPIPVHLEANAPAADMAASIMPRLRLPEAIAVASDVAASLVPRPLPLAGTTDLGPHLQASADVEAHIDDKPDTDMYSVEACAPAAGLQEAGPGSLQSQSHNALALPPAGHVNKPEEPAADMSPVS
ncbi:hypothetical protein WJX74_000736 [Apatococcus lobatus]|uniref:AP2/ERF domain-containing protein n=1 Tax=Apatococcus lobatus TaxID=904363 RepID=A0AAW1Q8D8_9CHLO